MATQEPAIGSQESAWNQWNTRPGLSFERLAETENFPWIQHHKDEFEDAEGGLVACFMKDPDSVSQRKDHVERVLEFCSDKALQDLEQGSEPDLLEKTCLLDDRSNDGNKSTSRGYHGPLTVRELQLKLQSERFVLKNGKCDQTSLSADDKEATGKSNPGISADRRLIYMPDLNRWGMMALMTTASGLDAAALRGTFHRYLSFESNISVRPLSSRFRSRGLKFYELSFDFPFYAWRTRPSNEKPPESHLKLNGKPVRTVSDMAFLKRETVMPYTQTETDYVCEGQVSVAIVAIDQYRWKAHCFADTYFDSEEERERAQKYHDEAGFDDEESYDAMQADPLTHGTFDANLPILNPLEYFWVVLEARLKQANVEWHFFVNTLEERINAYINSFQRGWKTSDDSTTTWQKSCEWVDKIRILFCYWMKTLKANIEEWTSFELDKRFSKEGVESELTSVNNIFRDLGKCVKKLEFLEKLCDTHEKNLNLHMNGEGNRDSKIQTETARSSHTLTNFGLLWVYPTTLAAAVLSMQEKAIPEFLGPAKFSFPALTIVLTTIVFLLFAWLDKRSIVPSWVLKTWEWSKESRAHVGDLESGRTEN